MDEIPEGYARVQWFKTFGGQKGQGIAIMPSGESIWIHGNDLQVEPDADGIKRPGGFGTLVKYTSVGSFGARGGKKLLGITLVR